LANRGGMMPEIVDHFHAARFAPDFLPPRDSFETGEPFPDFRQRRAVEPRRRNRHGRIAHVEFADERHFELVVAEREARALGGIGDVADLLRAIRRETNLDYLRE